jgi:hypothetical protein
VPPGRGTLARPTPSAINSVLINVVIPVEPGIDSALSGPRRKMASARAPSDLAAADSAVSAMDISDYFAQLVACTLDLACTGAPANAPAVIQAATAHSHANFVALASRRIRAREKVAGAIETGKVILEDTIDRPKLCRHISSAAARSFRPVYTAGVVQVTKTHSLKTRKGVHIAALWDLHWAAERGAERVIQDIPSDSSDQSTATVLADSLAREAPIAHTRVAEALRLADS